MRVAAVVKRDTGVCQEAATPRSRSTAGARDDVGAAAVAALRMRGVDGLRVVDASVMPRIVSANTNATVTAIGERASDLILADDDS